jgi:hypothetical protein
MSKQSEAKARQGYLAKPLARCCRNCSNLISESKYPDQIKYPEWVKEYLTCCIGDFAVKAKAVCREFRGKEG